MAFFLNLIILCKYAKINLVKLSLWRYRFAVSQTNTGGFSMKKLSIIVAMIVLTVVLSGCSSKTIYMQDTFSANSLEVEPTSWLSEESINTLLQANLPVELQKKYTELISSGYKEVIMKDPEGWQIWVNSDENGIYLGQNKNIVLKFFQSASGNVVEVGKNYRTLNRSEYFDDGKDRKAYDSIELDYLPEDTHLIKVAVTDDFSVMYNTLDNTYQCMQFGEVIGTSPVTNWDAITQPEKPPKAYGSNKGFCYNKDWYIPVIERDGDTTTFHVVKESEFDPNGNPSFSYVPMKIGNLEVNACKIGF